MTWQNIQGDMFDFAAYYDKTSAGLPAFSRIAEVGVANGKSAIYLAEKLVELGKDFEFYFIDNMDYGGAKQITEIVKNISASGLGKKITLLPVGSLDAAASFNDNFFDFVFLDSSHEYKQTKAELILWMQKVKDSCFLSGHDYYLYDEVKMAILELIPKETVKTYDTDKNYGVYELRKDWRFPLNYK